MSKTPNVTKKEIADQVARITGFPSAQVAKTVNFTLEVICEAIKAGRRVELRDFGVLDTVARPAREGFNPKDPAQPLQIPARRTIKFKAGRNLKNALKDQPPKTNEKA